MTTTKIQAEKISTQKKEKQNIFIVQFIYLLTEFTSLQPPDKKLSMMNLRIAFLTICIAFYITDVSAFECFQCPTTKHCNPEPTEATTCKDPNANAVACGVSKQFLGPNPNHWRCITDVETLCTDETTCCHTTGCKPVPKKTSTPSNAKILQSSTYWLPFVAFSLASAAYF